MNKIIVHSPQNESSKSFRYYNHFWFRFVDYLKTKFDVETDMYYEFANSRTYDVQLLNDMSDSTLLECEMIIENCATKEFVVLSVSDITTGAMVNHRDNPLCKKILIAQYNQKYLAHYISDSNKDKFSPWIYFPVNLYDIDEIYNERLQISDFIDKFCFWGTSLEERRILHFFNHDYFIGGTPIGDFPNYARQLIKHKMALSVSGRGEFCYRDVENFGLGVPIIRFEFEQKMYNELIPNYHYISVARPDDLIVDRLGDEKHARMIENRFLEVKDDADYLSFISRNARKYYDDYLTMDNSIKLTYKILGLNEWE